MAADIWVALRVKNPLKNMFCNSFLTKHLPSLLKRIAMIQLLLNVLSPAFVTRCYVWMCVCVCVCPVVSDSLRPHGL